MLFFCANSEDFDLAFWDDLGDDLRVEIKGLIPIICYTRLDYYGDMTMQIHGCA